MQYILFNGDLIDAKTALFSAKNRAFSYGDALFETMRVSDGKILFLNDHYLRLKHGINYLKMLMPAQFSVDFLESQINELLLKNRMPSNARIRLQVFRNEGGYYSPKNKDVSYVISCESLPTNTYKLNEKGLRLDIFADVFKGTDRLANVKTTNSLVYTLAGIYASDNELDDAIILNNHSNVAETISSNIFIVKNKEYCTPALNEGCIDGIMRGNVFRIMQAEKKKIHECALYPDDILNADEVFLTNVISGIKWVGAFKQKRYFNTQSKWLLAKLNEFIIKEELA
jgi:aminodeoxychorismate lyase